MKRFFLLSVSVCLVLCTLCAQQKEGGITELKGPYLGQIPPGLTPVRFAPDMVSTESHEFSCCFSTDGKEFYFTRMIPEQRQNYVMFTKMTDGFWTKPAIAPFAGPFTFEPMVTPDNKRIYFQIGKVTNGQLMMYSMYADRTPEGWSEAKDPGEPFNPMKTMHISTALNGNIYTTDISGGMGTESLGFIMMVNGAYKKLERLGPPLNTIKFSQHPWIAPDESYMIFTVRRPGQNPGSALFCTFRNNEGAWSEPVELNLGIEAGQPFVSPDGMYLFFSSGGGGKGSGDIYWVSAEIISKTKQ